MKTTSATLLGMMLLSPLVAALPQGNIGHSLRSFHACPSPFSVLKKGCTEYTHDAMPTGAPETIAYCQKRVCELWIARPGHEDLSFEECLSKVVSAPDADMSTIGPRGCASGDEEPLTLRSTIGPRSADISSDQIAQYEAAKERFREQMDNMNNIMNKQSPSSSYASPPDGIYAPPLDGIYPPPAGGWGSVDWSSIDWNSIDYPSIAGRAEETEDF